MSYACARGLGISYEISTPVGKQRIDIPVDKMVADAVDRATPMLVEKINQVLPPVLDKNWPNIERKIDGTVTNLRNRHLPAAMEMVKRDLPKTVDPYVKKAIFGGLVLVAAMFGAAYVARGKKA